MKQLILTFLLVLTAFSAIAEEKKKDKFYDDEGRGWFWYEVIEEVLEEEEKPEVPVGPNSKPQKDITMKKHDGPRVFSSAWIKANLPKLKLKAMDNPTDKNMAAYMYVNRMAMDKAHVFSDKFVELAGKDPLLNENSRVPMDAISKAAMLRSVRYAEEAAISGLKDKYGIWYFYDESCKFCARQTQLIRTFERNYGVKVQVIYKGSKPDMGDRKYRKDNGVFERLGLRARPAMVLMMPPNNIHVISEGVAGVKEISARVIVGLINSGMLSQDKIDELRPMSKGILKNSDMATLTGEEIDPDNPDSWLPELRRVMGANGSLYGAGRADYYNDETNEEPNDGENNEAEN